jgi:PBP1b-binding outer membrane lipoprotein LpoB
MMTQTKLLAIIALAGLLATGCSSQFQPSYPNTDPTNPSAAAQDPSNVFDHPPTLGIDPVELLDRIQKAGPARAPGQAALVQ